MPSELSTTRRNLTADAARDIAHVVHPYTNLAEHRQVGPLIIERGEGVFVQDEHGRRYLEGMAGLWSVSLGYSEKRLAEAAARQFERLPYAPIFNNRSHQPGIDLAEALVKIAPAGLNHVLFANSGSEANDQAGKIVWYHNNQIGRPAKKKLIARYHGYHGVTVLSGSLTGLTPVHADFDLPLPGVLHTDAPSRYHYGHDGETEDEFLDRIAGNLEALIQREGPETIAAFFAEPVNGGGGVIVPPPGYFARIQALLRKYDILFVVDEVITGFGRTGEIFGSFTYDLKPDILTAAKALSSSYLPISAVLLTDAIYESLVAGSARNGAFAHGVTYAAHPVAAAVALETLKIYEERDIVGHVRQVSRRFQERLRGFSGHPIVGEARGVGLLGAVELSREAGRRQPFEAKSGLGRFVADRALEHGIILRNLGDAIAFCPPLIITEDEIDLLFDGFARALDEGLDHARRGGWS
ncbi:aminotransferase class III-fold pyridoxal phosphate-dependent enzyme [Mycobacterium sp. KBS0706]|uniref:aminotransferase n=1 Tax=Mycobacterium sp. KBS0706 TaxID=2578109 RepID=UPI00110F8EA5|nr:aminotransferase [Mycobacterium sp. KBS0706]TSD85569.1 aminotransferase class III-fold pyridoxal phosphate-dependent enzyme [Mycobacterium sp. KBS0706]